MRVTRGNSKQTGRLYLDRKDTISEVKIPSKEKVFILWNIYRRHSRGSSRHCGNDNENNCDNLQRITYWK